jgi:hypothetical protein
MAFGMFRMMFSAGGNAVPVINQMNDASKHLMETSSGLSTSLNRVGTSMSGLVRATASLTQFKSVEAAISGVNAQARHLQPTVLDIAKSMRVLGRQVTGVTDAQLKLANSTDFENQQLAAGQKAKIRAANAYKQISESIRTVGATGQITSARLAGLSQTLELFAQNTGKQGAVEIQRFSSELGSASAQMKMAETRANALKNGQVNLSSAQRVAHAETVKISDALTRFSIVGGASSSVILRLANQLNTLSSSVHPNFSGSLKTASTELTAFGNQLRITEQAANKAGSAQGGFQMMTDVSEGAATKMRMMSSASQGAMIAMSLLQRNVTGLAFSLIFLQFSGFLKISLAIAGVIAVLGAAALSIRGLVNEGRRLKDLSNQIFIVTGDTTKFALAMDAARVISKSLGGGLSREMLDGIVAVGMQTGATNDELQALGKAMILLKTGALDPWVGSQEELIDKFVEWKKSGEDVGKEFGGLFTGLKKSNGEWQDRFENSFTVWEDSSKKAKEVAKENLGTAFQPIAEMLVKSLDTFVSNFMLGIAAFGFAIQGNFGSMWEALNLMSKGGWQRILLEAKAKQQAIQNEQDLADAERLLKEEQTHIKSQEENISHYAQVIQDSLDGLTTLTDDEKKEWAKRGQLMIEQHRASLAREKELKEKILELQKDKSHEVVKQDVKEVAAREEIQAKYVPVATAIAVNVADGIIHGTKSKEEESKSTFKSFGKSLADSLWEGFKAVPMVTMAFKIGEQIVDAFRRSTGSHSPSTEFMKIGQDAMKGFAIGMGGSGASRNSSNINITVNVKGSFSSDPRTASQSVATQVLKGITRQGAFSGAPLVA